MWLVDLPLRRCHLILVKISSVVDFYNQIRFITKTKKILLNTHNAKQLTAFDINPLIENQTCIYHFMKRLETYK